MSVPVPYPTPNAVIPNAAIPNAVTRRTWLRTASATAVASLVTAAAGAPAASAAPPRSPGADRLFRELDEKIQSGMERYAIPGAAVGVWYRGVEYVKGYGVTDVGHPVPVDGDTVFRIASTTKTFTGTTAMCLVEAGRFELDAPVRRYLPDFATSDPAVAARVTPRQLFNHTPGWLGDDYEDTGDGPDALARYVAGMVRLPQLTPPGTVFAYNNAALILAGRVIEKSTGTSYESAVRSLLTGPLGLEHTRFAADGLDGLTLATPHGVDAEGRPVPAPGALRLPRGINPAGGLLSSARDQLRYARFHLGDPAVRGGRGPLTQRSLRTMRSHPGPGGTLFVELDGVGITWMLRPATGGVRVVQHGGDLDGQHSGFLMVPERDFAITLLTNSETGADLVDELFGDDWALRRFAGVGNLPAVPVALSRERLAEYEGTYSLTEIADGELSIGRFELVAADGQLQVIVDGEDGGRVAFYRPDYLVVIGADGRPAVARINFVRGPGGRVDWLRIGGRLCRHESGTPSAARSAGVTRARSVPVVPLTVAGKTASVSPFVTGRGRWLI